MPLIHDIAPPTKVARIAPLPAEQHRFAHTTDLDLQMVLVPDGKFMLGEGKNSARREVSDFYLARTPVTQALWQAVMGSNPARFSGSRRPVEKVSWFECMGFCNKLSDVCGLPPYYKQVAKDNWTIPDRYAKGYRLPTEAEWEYAARWPHPPAPSPFRSAAWRGGETAGSQVASLQPEAGAPPLQNAHPGVLERGPGGEAQYSGSNHLPEVGWYTDNSHGETAEVALKLPNALGLYDMSGNVWEWCRDWYKDPYPETVEKDYLGPESGLYRVLRGGSWGSFAQGCRPVHRDGNHPVIRNGGIGLRLACGSPSV